MTKKEMDRIFFNIHKQNYWTMDTGTPKIIKPSHISLDYLVDSDLDGCNIILYEKDSEVEYSLEDVTPSFEECVAMEVKRLKALKSTT